MPKIFISYRRDDSAYPAHLIYSELRNHFGSDAIVFDIDSIPLGIDFRKYINDEISKCEIFLVVIGEHWTEILDKRFDENNDYVRIELQVAIARRIPIIPVLVGHATVPKEVDLPDEFKKIVFRQGAEVRAGNNLDAHLKQLIKGLERLLSGGAFLKKKVISKTYTNSLDMEFVYISPGSFVMGTPVHESIECGDELQHEVMLTNGFYIQTTPLTMSQWNMVNEIEAADIESGDLKIPDYSCPKYGVSWDEAQEFIKNLQIKDGNYRYRLPTESEWEYSCRAGTTTLFPFGDDADKLSDYAWYSDNSDEQNHTVGQKMPNDWGLYDMLGNVEEWCQDWFDAYPRERVINPYGPPYGDIRVLRGGSCFSEASSCRSGYRTKLNPKLWRFTGLRLVLDLD